MREVATGGGVLLDGQPAPKSNTKGKRKRRAAMSVQGIEAGQVFD
jgi:hypothetical protein